MKQNQSHVDFSIPKEKKFDERKATNSSARGRYTER